MDATIEVFNTITKELLPTPQKSHYTFNLRDLAKVFQGTQNTDMYRHPNAIMCFVRTPQRMRTKFMIIAGP